MRRFRVFSVLTMVLAGLFGIAGPAQAASGPWIQAAAGEGHTCGINTGGSLYCWGSNGSGQMANGTTTGTPFSPFRIGAAGVWTSVAAGESHTCGITTGKNLYCWGANITAQTGDGTTNTPRVGLFRVGAAGVWSSVAAGVGHTCGITTGKNLYCWGRNEYGQTGDGTTTTPRLTLHRVGAAGVWAAVSLGDYHTCAITTARNLYCWGYNLYGQTGDGTTNNPRLTLNRVGAAGVWTSVSGGGEHTCGITTAKNLYCWGYNELGQTGDGTTSSPRVSLFRVGGAGVWANVNAGGLSTCGITNGKNLYCWGSNGFGQTGDGTITTPRLTLNRVGGAGVWAGVNAGTAHTCGLTQAKNLYCWGYNAAGQIGDGGAQNPRLSLFRVT